MRRDHVARRAPGENPTPLDDGWLHAVKRWIRTADAAEYLGVTEATLKCWRSRGTGPRYRKLNAKLVVYKIADIDEWLERADTVRETADTVDAAPVRARRVPR